MPMTTKQNKAKSFVNELAELTQTVQKELGGGHMTQKVQKKSKMGTNLDLMGVDKSINPSNQMPAKKVKSEEKQLKIQNFMERK